MTEGEGISWLSSLPLVPVLIEFLGALFFRAVLDSQPNWKEGAEIFLVISSRVAMNRENLLCRGGSGCGSLSASPGFPCIFPFFLALPSEDLDYSSGSVRLEDFLFSSSLPAILSLASLPSPEECVI